MSRALLRPAWLVLAALMLLTCLTAEQAAAQPKMGLPAPPPGVAIEVAPLLGEATVHNGHWFELLVRVRNRSASSFNGTVEAYGAFATWNNERRGRVYAPLQVAAGTSVTLRLPVVAGYSDEPQVHIKNAAGAIVLRQEIRSSASGQTILLNVPRSAALTAHLEGVPVTGGFEPWSNSAGYSASTSGAHVITPRYDDITGGPLLPHRAAGYSRIATVLIESAQLARLGAQELEALGGYVMGGGTLAVVVTRPEDMRHATVQALIGGEAQRVAAHKKLLDPLTLRPAKPSGTGSGLAPTLPSAATPPGMLMDELHSYQGGNLQPTAYGAGALYGLGEVHLLGFNPNKPPANDSKWVHVRMLDLLRRANERTSGAVLRHGEESNISRAIQRRLDPNQGARWAIVLATILLIGYAVVAGPVSYSHWRRKNRPLQAIFRLPLLSLGMFVLIFMLGLAAKGVRGRARHLLLVDAGAGMHTGIARRYRAFFVPSERTISVAARSASSVLMSERDGYQLNESVSTVVDQNGSRLDNAELHPWEAHLVREDDYADLGSGVAIQPDASGEPRIKNNTGRELQGLLLVHGRKARFLEKLGDGETAALADFDPLPESPMIHDNWHSGMPFRSFDPSAIDELFEDADAGLADAWEAVDQTQANPRDWFPNAVPVLLAQVKGGEGTQTDAGLRVDQQRMLLRVVGWGGKL